MTNEEYRAEIARIQAEIKAVRAATAEKEREAVRQRARIEELNREIAQQRRVLWRLWLDPWVWLGWLIEKFRR